MRRNPQTITKLIHCGTTHIHSEKKHKPKGEYLYGTEYP